MTTIDALQKIVNRMHDSFEARVRHVATELQAELDKLKSVGPVATKLMPDPYDERGGNWYSNEDIKKLNALPVGTKLYAAPQQDVQDAIDATLESSCVWDSPRALQIDSYATGREQAGQAYVIGDEITVEYTDGIYAWKAHISKPTKSRKGSNPLVEAQARIAELEERLIDTAKLAKALNIQSEELTIKNDDLTAQLAEAIKDAERYKMLCGMIKHVQPEAPGKRGKYMLYFDSTQTLDEVVDEYIRSAKHIEATRGTLKRETQ